MQGVSVRERKMPPDDRSGLLERLTERRYERREGGGLLRQRRHLDGKMRSRLRPLTR